MTKLYVIRHGKRLDHENSSWKQTAARPFDPPLADIGHTQAKLTAQYLEGLPIKAIYVSPFIRTLQTAGPIADQLGLPLYVEGGIAEWLNPKWYDYSAGLLTPTQAQEQFPQVDTSYRPLVTPRYPEPEEAICQARVEFVARHIAQTAGGDVLFVSHGVCVLSIVERLVGRRGEAKDDPCAVNVLENGLTGWRLAYSSVAHLEPKKSL